MIIILGFLGILNIYLFFQFFKLKNKLQIFFQGSDSKNLEQTISKEIKKTKEQEKELKKLAKQVAELEKISQKTFQKIGLIRFNPFQNVGGDQSFSIALLDAQNNGFVISSLYSREGNRVYAKAIKQGKSQYPLSEEEEQAIKKAIGL
ncbi:hypothetical protein AMJ49_06825 [Parcubacteria bacterium DG_74_2]|nr:MAG: hypothetical protein AMJ49_06825 [Parcubacteria bacterium DG_74_2]